VIEFFRQDKNMPFISVPGIPGQMYVPEEQEREKKHPCPDCSFCQWCSDERCELCLRRKCCQMKEKGPEM
jgi:hypothetical protein